MKSKLHIGCSAFDNWQWQGVFYPDNLDRRDFFDYYCRFFTTFEINGTFYKPPTIRSLLKWNRDSPPDFTFSVKAPKLITHVHRLENCTDLISRFYGACGEGIGEKLRCVLFQFPASFQYDQRKLELILENVDSNFRNVIEFRHQSWWRDDVFKSLLAHDITFCAVSYPGLPEDFAQTNRIRYVRLHGVPELFYSEYPKLHLQQLHQSIIREDTDEAYVYFNNTASPAGIKNAMFFSEFSG